MYIPFNWTKFFDIIGVILIVATFLISIAMTVLGIIIVNGDFMAVVGMGIAAFMLVLLRERFKPQK